jgi:hypothetical protein
MGFVQVEMRGNHGDGGLTGVAQLNPHGSVGSAAVVGWGLASFIKRRELFPRWTMVVTAPAVTPTWTLFHCLGSVVLPPGSMRRIHTG